MENDKVILFYKRFETYFPILNFLPCNCILGGDVLYACAKFQSEISVRNDIIKDILKKKNDVH